MQTGWVVRAWLYDREITKHTDTEANAKKIAKKLKEAAATLGLMDQFKIEVQVSEH